jgi:hypothetical protein
MHQIPAASCYSTTMNSADHAMKPFHAVAAAAAAVNFANLFPAAAAAAASLNNPFSIENILSSKPKKTGCTILPSANMYQVNTVTPPNIFPTIQTLSSDPYG